MKFLKEKKGIIISFIIGVILASSITAYATGYLASQIKYKDDQNVEQALNDLYSKQKLGIEDLELVADVSETSHSNRRSTITKNFSVEKDNIYYVELIYAAAGGTIPQANVCFYNFENKFTFSENITVLGQCANLIKIKANETSQATLNVSGNGTSNNHKDILYFKIYK